MEDTGSKIEISEDDGEAGNFIESQLTASLRAALPQSENRSFVLSARDGRNCIVGGLTATTSYGWLLVKSLWVAEEHRRHGLGRALMKSVEDKASRLGCHDAWLDTSNPEAKEFYVGMGYEIFGELGNAADQHPPHHRRWFLKKSLNRRAEP